MAGNSGTTARPGTTRAAATPLLGEGGEQVGMVAKFFRALGDPTRLRLLEFLLAGEHTVVGRSFMVHEDPDDLGKGDNSEPGPPPVNGKCSFVTGNAGARLACGEIKSA